MGAGNYPLILAGQRAVAGAVLTAMLPLTVIKPSDESVTSSTALQDDNDLFATLAGNATYIFTCYLNYEGGTLGSSDLKWQWNAPAGATMRFGVAFTDTSGNNQVISYQNGVAHPAGTNGGGSVRSLVFTGTVIMSTTPGNIQLQWAQNTSSGTATTVHVGSSLSLTRVS